MSAERAWAEWLDAVASAARSLEHQASIRSVAQQPYVLPMGAMPALPVPPGPWPASLEDRGREVLATLAAATEAVETRRDETAAALRGLAHTPVRATRTSYTDGSALDVVG